MRRSGRRSGVAKCFILMVQIIQKGVCVLIKPNSPIQAEIVELGTSGRFIILRLKTPGETSFSVVNIYAPTVYREQAKLIESFPVKIVSATDSSNLIIAGDRNTTLNSINKQGVIAWKETIKKRQEFGSLFHESGQSN